jgi:hypothetical protein
MRLAGLPQLQAVFCQATKQHHDRFYFHLYFRQAAAESQCGQDEPFSDSGKAQRDKLAVDKDPVEMPPTQIGGP